MPPAAKEKNVIVIKKITVGGHGHHGGSWKVALADFMTALMAFFLLMWLLAQTPEIKKNVSDYFSTPSVIEYNFSNFGVELTLEKLFLDLVNEPLKTLQEFNQPMDYTPNYLQMGSKNIVMSVLSEEVGDFASGFNVNGDEIVIEIPESALFVDGSANTRPTFAHHIDKLAQFTAGLEDADIRVESVVYLNSVGNSATTGKNVAQKRMDLVLKNIDKKLEHQSVDLHQKVEARAGERRSDGRPKEGFIKFTVKQKEVKQDGTKPRKFSKIFGPDDSNMDVYNNFVNKMANAKKTKAKLAAEKARHDELFAPQKAVEVDNGEDQDLPPTREPSDQQ
jgi:chemotaxis protein MotB